MRLAVSKKVVEHRCVDCGRQYPHSFRCFCECGGMIDVHYDLARSELRASTNTLERYADLLPVEDPARLLGQSLERTPCRHATRLGAELGMPWLFLKDETVLPTRTTKDRMAAVALAYLYECGVREFCTSSTGNSSTAFARAVTRYPDSRIFLFTAAEFAERLECRAGDQVISFVLEGASFVDAFQFAASFAERQGLVAERGFFNPGRREGLKLAFLEAAEQVPVPIDWYVQSVSSAMGVYGTSKGAQELYDMKLIDRIPRLLCVQQETCSPMVHAWQEGSAEILSHHIVELPQGIAKAILRGDPTRAYRYICPTVRKSDGGFVSVTENEIREARRMAEELEGVTPCFSASAALAGLIRRVRRDEFPKTECVLVNLTGGDRPPAESVAKVHRLMRSAEGWVPVDATDEDVRCYWPEARRRRVPK